jgi:hypothetical protein
LTHLRFSLSEAIEIVRGLVGERKSEVLDTASGHDFRCECDTCLEWWVYMGPDPDLPLERRFGPFAEEQVISKADELGEDVFWKSVAVS